MKRSDGAARTLAHEVLHDCGLEDIYTVENPDSSDPNPIPGMASRERLPDDWGGGYYQPGLTQRSLVTRLIMRSGGFSPDPPHARLIMFGGVGCTIRCMAVGRAGGESLFPGRVARPIPGSWGLGRTGF